jgi:hypothetical protein
MDAKAYQASVSSFETNFQKYTRCEDMLSEHSVHFENISQEELSSPSDYKAQLVT